MTASSRDSNQAWEPPSPADLQAMIPTYEIGGFLGRGGMGAVYKGMQATLEREVAIKLLPESLAEVDDDTNYVERFKLEARAMAGLDHPAIVSVYDFGQTSDGHLYFVMEFIDGMDIQKYIEVSGGTVSAEHSVAIVSHVLDALDYAHAKGIVHRDIKPANVLINREGRVKIADFGLAKEMGTERAPANLTVSNVAMGTPDYIAPESLEIGSVPDARADIYAVGVMLYQMLTGKLPRGMFRLPSERVEGLDPRIDDIITLAMESDPEHRYQSASAFRQGLAELSRHPVSRIGPSQDPDSVSPPAEQFDFTEPQVRSRLVLGPARQNRVLDPVPPKRSSLGKVVFGSLVAVFVIGFGMHWFYGKFGSKWKKTELDSILKEARAATISGMSEDDHVSGPPLTFSTDWVGPISFWSKENKVETAHRRAEGINDAVQIQLFEGGWIALRENGQTVSSNPEYHRKGIYRITKGWGTVFGLIDRAGNLEVLGSQAAVPPKPVSRVLDAFISEYHSLALRRNGTITTWGVGYDRSEKDPERWQPAPENLRNIKTITGSRQVAAALSEDGKITAWHADGPAMENWHPEITQNTTDLAAREWGFQMIAANGEMHWWNINGGSGTSRNLERFGPMEAIFESPTELIFRMPDGTTAGDEILMKSNSDFSDAMKSLNHAPEEAFSLFRTPGDGDVRFAWIEPAGS